MNSHNRLARIWAHRATLDTLVRRDLRVRYARSVLGYLWTLIDPLAMALVYAFVFGFIYGGHGKPGLSSSSDQKWASTDGVPIVLFLVAGLLAYNWFSNVINESSRALYAERLLVRSTNLPRELWVMRVVISKGIEHLLSLPILLGFLVFYMLRGEVSLSWEIVFWIPALIVQFILLTGIGLVMAPVTALVDDFARITRIGLRVLFYVTPIVYSLHFLEAKLPEGWGWAKVLIQLNPLTGIADMYRAGFLTEYGPDWMAWLYALIVSLAWLAFGSWVFRKLEPAILKEI
ncbi:ABC transporter permease [Dermacoccus barathri]|uniref:Transport permease protein n=1 Tax=Dermacoccus barathri TaxID=322601 RepID=A0ABN2C8J8_9MICO